MTPVIPSSHYAPAGEPCFRRCIAVATALAKAPTTPSIIPRSPHLPTPRQQTPDRDRRFATAGRGQCILYARHRRIKSP